MLAQSPERLPSTERPKGAEGVGYRVTGSRRVEIPWEHLSVHYGGESGNTSGLPPDRSLSPQHVRHRFPARTSFFLDSTHHVLRDPSPTVENILRGELSYRVDATRASVDAGQERRRRATVHGYVTAPTDGGDASGGATPATGPSGVPLLSVHMLTVADAVEGSRRVSMPRPPEHGHRSALQSQSMRTVRTPRRWWRRAVSLFLPPLALTVFVLVLYVRRLG
jgi:hypothetical protein